MRPSLGYFEAILVILILLFVVVFSCILSISMPGIAPAKPLFLVALLDFIKQWQELIGSALGAVTAIVVLLYSERLLARRKRKEYLLLMEKSLVTAINNLSEIDKMLHAFIEQQLGEFVRRVQEDNAAGRYSVGTAFIPLTNVFQFENGLLRESSESNYVENLITDVLSTSQGLPFILQDINRQFEHTINFNTQLGLMKVNSVAVHNMVLLQNMDAFRDILMQQTLSHNIPVYVRKLVCALVALRTLNKWGLPRWRATFNYPLSMSAQERGEEMDKYFEAEVNDTINQFQQYFISRLLRVNEESPLRAMAKS